MTTAGDLVSRVSRELHGYGSVKEQVTALSAALTNTALTFTVSDVSGQLGLTPGVVEIDSELIYVSSIDIGTKTATVASFGRGFGGTTATTHDSGAVVTSSPSWPRLDILNSLNQIIQGLYPSLFAVNVFTSTVKAPTDTYTLTTGSPDLIRVLDAQWKDPLGDWQRCAAYAVDPYNGTFRLAPGAIIGRDLRVLYASRPVSFTDETTDFNATGLPDSCEDLLVLGSVARLSQSLATTRAQLNSVEQSDRSKVVPSGQAINVAKLNLAEFENRLQIEAAALRKKYKPILRRDYNR